MEYGRAWYFAFEIYWPLVVIIIFPLYHIIVRVQTYQNHYHLPQKLQNSDFQSHLSVLKISGIFLIFFSWRILRLYRRPTLSSNCLRRPQKNEKIFHLVLSLFINVKSGRLVFLNLYFLKMWQTFVSFVNNFGRSDDGTM